MTYSNGYSHTVVIADEQSLKDELKALVSYDQNIVKALYNNFVMPIENGLCPFAEMTGRYKPSCEMDYIESPMKNAFIRLARDNKLYHYHFGYKYYRDGDPNSNHQGMVSDGIIHTKLIINEENKTVEHRIIQICVSHPTPFTVPYERINY